MSHIAFAACQNHAQFRAALRAKYEDIGVAYAVWPCEHQHDMHVSSICALFGSRYAVLLLYSSSRGGLISGGCFYNKA